ncbi:MAG: YihY/virulence factor BrkB family protein [Anaerolineales bacterium]|nr:YihY/virulence factor BrkB family protein [Anaerolineales bacterium]
MGRNETQDINTPLKRLTRPFISVYRVIKNALDGFSEARSPESAAATAFFTIFSLFPLLIFIVAVGSFFVDEQTVKDEIVELVPQIIPVEPTLIEENIVEVLRLRGEATLIGIIGLAWSATGALTLLSRNINRAFPDASVRGFIGARLVGFAIMVFLVCLLALSFLARTVLDILSQYSIPIFGYDILAEIPLDTILTQVFPLLLGFIIFTNLYYWIPAIKVPWSAAMLSALITAVAWEIATFGFVWYLRSGLAEYRLVYGSLGTIVAIMFWIYLNFTIVYFGAHLASAISKHLTSKKGEVNT